MKGIYTLHKNYYYKIFIMCMFLTLFFKMLNLFILLMFYVARKSISLIQVMQALLWVAPDPHLIFHK